MLLLYLLLVVAGLLLTARLYSRGSWHALTAAAGTLLSVLAVIGGFSIGIYVAPVAALVLLIAATGLRGRGSEQSAPGGQPGPEGGV